MPVDARRFALTPKLITVLREGYGVDRLRRDAVAGLTVAIVALPLAMALAIASGASPDKGLATAVVAGFLISALGGSRVQVGGPTGAFVVVVFNVIAQHGYDGLVLATLTAGLMLIAAGYAKLGSLIRYIPHPVITGFTAGIAVIIASSQVKDFLGLSIDKLPADFIAKWQAYFSALGSVQWEALVLGVASFLLILALRRSAPRLPGFLIAVIAASFVATLLQLPVETIGSRFPDLPTGLPAPSLPDISWAKLQAVMPSAFTIAFLAGIEALLSAVVADGMIGSRHRSNQELVGQGVANMASALFGGLPATGALARTATNIKAGALTPVAGMLHAIFLLLFMLLASGLMAYVPLAALAAILFVVAWGMSEHERFMRLLRMPGGDRALLLLTFALTVLVDLTVAIGVGVTLASLLFMMRMSRTVAIAGGLDELSGDMEDEREDVGQRDGLPRGVEVFRIEGPLFFGVADELLDILRRVGPTPKAVILRMRRVPLLDASGAAALEQIVTQACAAGTHIIFSGTQAQPLDMLRRHSLGLNGRQVTHRASFTEALQLAAAIADPSTDPKGSTLS
ncbi:Putative sulfate transporter yvdB [Novosphingobium lubricantis]|uniref:Putative sulfate transporter yvdB n=1 Tax=Novosphingobium pentaromativorans US6-1 TaxID=1088721 RepID=G6EKB1_9SPHN|nr:SulP family inorganic anion transporter [Novosphingobium pentaromativorans]AIT82427.1 sulfate permease [Novosphingobium pentaromativorans US6-1]EHJ58252.1 putative sulfate transporter yvdB [Novosphingobium pentaromativorans US6-1]